MYPSAVWEVRGHHTWHLVQPDWHQPLLPLISNNIKLLLISNCNIDIQLLYRYLSERTHPQQKLALPRIFLPFFEKPMELVRAWRRRQAASIFPPKIAFVCLQLFLHSFRLFDRGGDAERKSIRYKVNSENSLSPPVLIKQFCFQLSSGMNTTPVGPMQNQEGYEDCEDGHGDHHSFHVNEENVCLSHEVKYCQAIICYSA